MTKGRKPRLEAPKDDETVVSLRRGLDLMRAFRPGDDTLSRQELVVRTGLPKATVSRLLHTLMKLGYVVRLESVNRYQLGLPVLALGRALFEALPVRRSIRPIMQSLANSLKASVAIAIGERLEMLYLDFSTGEQTVNLRLGPGSLVPMGTTSIGRAYLWALPAKVRSTVLSRIEQQSGESSSLVLDGIKRSFRELEERGFCTSLGAWRREVFAVAAPLTFNNGDTILSLNVGVESLGVSEKYLYETCGPELLKAVREIKNALGQSGADDIGFGESWTGGFSSPIESFVT